MTKPRTPRPGPPGLVPRLGVELLADVVDDLRHVLVEVIELVHEEGVVPVRVRGYVLQLVLGGPGDADGVGDDPWVRKGIRLVYTWNPHTSAQISSA